MLWNDVRVANSGLEGAKSSTNAEVDVVRRPVGGISSTTSAGGGIGVLEESCVSGSGDM